MSALTAAELQAGYIHIIIQIVACTHRQHILTSSWQQQKEAFQ